MADSAPEPTTILSNERLRQALAVRDWLLGEAREVAEDRAIAQGVVVEGATDEDEGPLRGIEHGSELIEVLVARGGDVTGSGQVDGGVGLEVEDVLGEDDGDGAGSGAFGGVKGAGDGFGGLVGVDDLDDELRDV
jgi:hypothetical protein